MLIGFVKVREIRGSAIMGTRVSNVYNVNDKQYLLKFSISGDTEKVMLLLESGIRFHPTYFNREMPDFPSPFTMKLRRFLRSKRLEDVVQLGKDR